MPFLSNFNEFIKFLTFAPLHLNWIDFLILAAVIFYAIEGYAVGFVRSSLDFLSFIFSFLFGLIFYSIFADFIVAHTSIPQGFANAIGFFLAAFIAEILVSLVIRRIMLAFYAAKKDATIPSPLNNFLGVVPGALSAFVLIAFILTLMVVLPVSPFLKNSVFQSRMGNYFVTNTMGFDKKVGNIFGPAIHDAMAFLTVEPKSNEVVDLHFKTDKFTIDKEAEAEMLLLVNKEREKESLPHLNSDYPLTLVARSHCADMAQRGYFSHYTPEGKSPFDRMDEANISYTSAGENLALAPNVALAMQGLMNSPGHRANILSKDFGLLGVGVIDAGIYGELFCQEFNN